MSVIRLLLTVVWLGLFLVAGCNSSQPLPLERQLADILVSATEAGGALQSLSEEGMLSTDRSISLFKQHGYCREAGIVRFDSEGSLVERKSYIQVRRRMILPPFTQEKFHLLIQTVIPQELLSEPYDSPMRKYAAIVRYCREALIEDARPFLEDQKTGGLVGMARWALQEADVQLADRPREGHQLFGGEGFSFTHSVFGRSVLRLIQDKDHIFTLTFASTDWTDPFETW